MAEDHNDVVFGRNSLNPLFEPFNLGGEHAPVILTLGPSVPGPLINAVEFALHRGDLAIARVLDQFRNMGLGHQQLFSGICTGRAINHGQVDVHCIVFRSDKE